MRTFTQRKCLRCKHQTVSSICYNCYIAMGMWNIDRTKYPDKIADRKPFQRRDAYFRKGMLYGIDTPNK